MADSVPSATVVTVVATADGSGTEQSPVSAILGGGTLLGCVCVVYDLVHGHTHTCSHQRRGLDLQMLAWIPPHHRPLIGLLRSTR